MKTRVKLVDERAVLPAKAHPSDVGYDLTIIDVHKTCLPDGSSATSLHPGLVVLFDTGVILEPPPGIYYEMVPRSSLSKTGWILANSVGVIDPHYRGTIKVPLMRASLLAKEIKLPGIYVQLIPKAVIPMEMVRSDDLNLETDRGDGGFGSTSL